MNPNLIKVFKPGAPDTPLYADQGQINAMPDKLIKWDKREAWLAAREPKAKPSKAEKPKAAKADPEEGEDQPPAPQPKAPVVPTKAELLKLASERGIAVTKRMTVELLQAALDGKQPAGPNA